MGNDISEIDFLESATSPSKSLFRRKKQKQSLNNGFILHHLQSNSNAITDISSLDQKRAVFISLFGLFQTWKSIPSMTLYSSLFILPIKKKWIFNPSRYLNEIQKTFNDGQLNSFEDEIQETVHFIQLLQWKCSQNLLFFMLDTYKKPSNIGKIKNKHSVCSFWYYLSNQLQTLYDATTNSKYKPLQLTENYWKEQYGSNVEQLNDLFDTLCLLPLNMKYKIIDNILTNSNPNSFNIITRNYHSYNRSSFNLFEQEISKLSSIDDDDEDNDDDNDDEDDDDDDDNDDGWFMSQEYDPTELIDAV